MLHMFRFRRYRVYLIFATVLVILLIRFTRTSQWERYGQADVNLVSPPKKVVPVAGGSTPPKDTPPKIVKENPQETRKSSVVQIQSSSSSTLAAIRTPAPVLSSTKPIATEVQSAPQVVIPDRKIPPAKSNIVDEQKVEDLHPIAPDGRQDLPVFSAAPTTIHWKKQTEHFPVPTESIIHLPTGPPAIIPKIQHRFNDETPDAKINREKRQSMVKQEFKKAWAGYKKAAWLHDELLRTSVFLGIYVFY